MPAIVTPTTNSDRAFVIGSPDDVAAWLNANPRASVVTTSVVPPLGVAVTDPLKSTLFLLVRRPNPDNIHVESTEPEP